MIKVNRKKFFSYVNPRNIVLRTERDKTFWETKNRMKVGETNGYMRSNEVEEYFLTEKAYKEGMKQFEKLI